MDSEWNDSQPIYRQLRDRVVAMILDGLLNEGDPLPSVRNVAAEYRVKSAHGSEGLSATGRRAPCREQARSGHVHQCGCAQICLFEGANAKKFLSEEWPRVHATIERLGLAPEELLKAAASRRSSSRRQRRSAEAMACIEARGLRKAFGATIALDGIDLRVEEGRILGLIGPNGAGKTTALNAILGLPHIREN